MVSACRRGFVTSGAKARDQWLPARGERFDRIGMSGASMHRALLLLVAVFGTPNVQSKRLRLFAVGRYLTLPNRKANPGPAGKHCSKPATGRMVSAG